MAKTVRIASFYPVGSHTVDSTISGATPLTPPAGATMLLLQALTQNVRFTLDGTTPTASTGFQLEAGAPPTLIEVAGGFSVKVIEETASGVIQYQWGK